MCQNMQQYRKDVLPHLHVAVAALALVLKITQECPNLCDSAKEGMLVDIRELLDGAGSLRFNIDGHTMLAVVVDMIEKNTFDPRTN